MPQPGRFWMPPLAPVTRATLPVRSLLIEGHLW
jgi:hypothetical protein